MGKGRGGRFEVSTGECSKQSPPNQRWATRAKKIRMNHCKVTLSAYLFIVRLNEPVAASKTKPRTESC